MADAGIAGNEGACGDDVDEGGTAVSVVADGANWFEMEGPVMMGLRSICWD
jgi:hypothetical protein